MIWYIKWGTTCYVIPYMLSYTAWHILWHDIWYDVYCDIWYDIWYDKWCDIGYNVWYMTVTYQDPRVYTNVWQSLVVLWYEICFGVLFDLVYDVVTFFPDPGSLLTRKVTFPKITPFEAVAATCSSPQTHLWIHGRFSHTCVVRRCGKTDRRPQTIISHPPRQLQSCRFCGHQ